MALKNVRKFEVKSTQTGNNTTAALLISQKISISSAQTISNAKYYITVNQNPNARTSKPANNSAGEYWNQMTTTMVTFKYVYMDHT